MRIKREDECTRVILLDGRITLCPRTAMHPPLSLGHTSPSLSPALSSTPPSSTLQSAARKNASVAENWDRCTFTLRGASRGWNGKGASIFGTGIEILDIENRMDDQSLRDHDVHSGWQVYERWHGGKLEHGHIHTTYIHTYMRDSFIETAPVSFQLSFSSSYTRPFPQHPDLQIQSRFLSPLGESECITRTYYNSELT